MATVGNYSGGSWCLKSKPGLRTFVPVRCREWERRGENNNGHGSGGDWPNPYLRPARRRTGSKKEVNRGVGGRAKGGRSGSNSPELETLAQTRPKLHYWKLNF